MRQILLLFIMGAVAFAGNAQTANSSLPSGSQPATQAFPKAGEWPSFRRSNTLEAHSPLKGSITSPTVVWKQFVGALESLVVIEPGGRKAVILPADQVNPANPSDTIPFRSFVPKPSVEDENQMDQTTFTYVDILPEYPGKEKLEFESAFTKPMVNGQWPPCVGRCLAKKNGEWITVWETKEIKDLFHALPLVADYDGDGTMEIGILPFYQLKLLDIRTGRVKDSVRFNDNRSYGFAGIYDFNHDGKTELLVQADFSKHVDVIGYRDGKLSVLWTQNIEQDIAHPAKILRVAPDPTADVDGDGQREVITTIYNDGGDGKWHVSFMDAMTGKKKYDFPDEYFGAPLDVDGDGVPEILTTVTSGGGTLAKIRVHSIKGGQPRILWEKDKASWETWYPNLGNNVKTMATLSQRTILSQQRGKKLYVVLREELSPTQTRISVAHWNGGFKTTTSVTGEHLDGLGLDATGRLLVRSRHQFGKTSSLAVTDGKVVRTSTRRIGLEPGVATVAWPDGVAEPTIVVQSSILEQVTFQPPKTPDAVVRFNHIPGRAQGMSWPKTFGPVIADLAGDGKRQIIVADAGPSGCARLSVKDLAGKVIWQHEFPLIAGTPPPANTGGVILWQAGHFRDKTKMDVLVTTQRSKMHSEETYLLSGTDGKLIWHRDKQISKRAVGGNSFAIADYDGDGLDDLASLWPSILYTIKGSTGQDILAMDAYWKEVYNKQVYFGQAVAGNFLNDGKPSFYFSGRLMTGVITKDGKLVWFDALDLSAPYLPCFGDFDGDGRMEAIGVGYEDGVRCYETATGRIKWRMNNPGEGFKGYGTASEVPVHGTASGDLDSDGRDEALVAMNNSLYCLAAPKSGLTGELKWHVDLPSRLGPPTIVQLEKDGPASILIIDSDGYLYCLR